MKTGGGGSREGYHAFVNEDGEEHGSFEVFYDNGDGYGEVESGFYWHACFPGYLPDGDASGPFENSYEAYCDARGEDY